MLSLLTNGKDGRWLIGLSGDRGLTVIAAMLVCNPEEEIGQQGCIYDSLVPSRDSWLLQNTDFTKLILRHV